MAFGDDGPVSPRVLLAVLFLMPGCAARPGSPDAPGSGTPDSLVGIFPGFDGVAPTCKEVRQALPFKPRIVDVLILFDRSGSMNTAHRRLSKRSTSSAA